MKSGVLLCGLALTMVTMVLGFSGTAGAADVVYTDTQRDSLQPLPAWTLLPGAGHLFPGTTVNPGASNNSVTVNFTSGGPIPDPYNVLAGLSENGVVYGNRVTISGGTVDGNVYGGRSSSGNATDNRVTISGTAQIDQDVSGGYSISGSAYGNRVIISTGTVSGFVSGGYSNSGSAYGNTVTISGGTVTDSVYGGSSYSGSAYGNRVTISGGAVNGNVSGGSSWNGSATGNTVDISGGTVTQSISGGYSFSGSATNNTVILSGAPAITGYVYGGDVFTGSGDVFTGNRLIVNNLTSTINAVANFQNYQFTLGSHVAAGNAALSVTNAVNLAGTNVGITHVDPGINPMPGDTFLLIDNINANQHSGVIGPALGGFTRAYFFDYNSSGSQLIATYSHFGASPQAKAYSEGRLSNLAFLGQRNDLLMGRALPHIIQVYKSTPDANWQPFAIMQGGYQCSNTGSSIRVEGVSTIMGLAYRPTNGALTMGAFFEGGWGDYNTHNNFSNLPSVKGDGSTEYYGGGILARYDFAGGFYAQGTVSFGQTSNDFKSNDIISGASTAKYDSDSMYYGANLGLGYLVNITDKAELDIYARYLWTHMESDRVVVVTDPVRFKATDSHRMQLGSRLNYELITGCIPYIGLAYDREFASDVKAATYGLKIDAPDIKGHTGIGELGVSFKSSMLSGLYLDFGAQGYLGQREGISGTFQVKYLF